MSATTATTAHSSGSSRKLGAGYSLALKCGGNPETHLTLVYFNSCRRGFEQDQVKAQTDAYFASQGVASVDFTLGEPFNERSRRVRGEVIERAIRDLTVLFSNWDIDKNQVPHIDLRGNAESAIQCKGVSVVGNYLF